MIVLRWTGLKANGSWWSKKNGYYYWMDRKCVSVGVRMLLLSVKFSQPFGWGLYT